MINKTLNKILNIASVIGLALNLSAAPEVTGIVAKQRFPWNGLVDISCNVTGLDGITEYEFVVSAVMPDSGSTNELSSVWVVRDGANSADLELSENGNYHLIWDAQADLGAVRYANMVVSVNLRKWHPKVQLWEGGPYWAETNIGADEPWESGYYFWWGDTVGYKRENDAWVASDGSNSNFSFSEDNTPTYRKYNYALQSEGWITGDGVLAPEHDAAHVHWGGKWRMPTKSELDALNSNCDWTWTTMNGVNGYVVRGGGKYSSASIFLPAAGYGYGTSLGYAGSGGCYWSSVPSSDYGYYAWGLYFRSSNHSTSNLSRYYGLSVRPVQGFTDALSAGVAKNVLSAGATQAADSAQFLLDTATQAVESLSITWDASWIGGDDSAEVVIADNGVEVKRATGAGEFTYSPAGIGRHELTYTTYIGGVAQDETYSATLFKDWKYEVVDGSAVITDTAQKSGTVTIPTEIDGLPVTGIAFGAFEGCSGIETIVFEGDVPIVSYGAFDGLSENCSVIVRNEGSGWESFIPGTWNGVNIDYVVPVVKFDANGGEVDEVICQTDGGVVGQNLPVALRVGYLFAGWWTDATGGEQIEEGTVLSCSIVAFAHWDEAAPEVTGIVAKQRFPWNGLVDISCNVTGLDGITECEFVVSAVMPDSGSTNELSSVWVVRDGANSADLELSENGNYHLIWDAQADLGAVRYANMVVSVNIKWRSKVQLWEGGPYWAEANIGADEPWESGYYFWWGDTVGYKRENDAWVASDGSNSNFSFSSSNTPTYRKYNDALQSGGWITGDGVLAPEHDAAHVHWGGNWRMPTLAELDALNSNCDWTWTTMNGVNGHVVRGRGDYSSASIFLPAAGLGDGTSLGNSGSGGHYWSSVPDSACNYSLYLNFSSGNHSMFNYYRWLGFPVRPVQGVIDALSAGVAKNVLSAGATQAADSAQFLLDTATISSEPFVESLSITWDASWIGGDDGAEVVIADNGVEVKRATATGEFTYSPAGIGRHELTYTTYVGGVAQDETYSATLFKDWKYEVVDGSAVITDMAQKSGPVTIPTEIDGLPVVSFGTLDLRDMEVEGEYEYNGLRICNGWVLGCGDDMVDCLEVPEGIVGIAPYALSDLWDLEDVVLPESLKYIGYRAFYADGYLGEGGDLVIPDAVEIIEDEAFRDCSWIPGIQMGEGVRKIGARAFEYNASLTTLRLPDAIEEIGDNAFLDCSKLRSVKMPALLERIGVDPFAGCSLLTGVTVPVWQWTMAQVFPSRHSSIVSVTLLGGEGEIVMNAFKGCSSLTDIVIPYDVTNICDGAFMNCSSMTSIELPENLAAIGADAFRGCSRLTAIVLPDSVSNMGANVFYGCSSLGNVTLSRSIAEIPDYAFYNCGSLTSIVMPEVVTNLGNYISTSLRAVYFLCDTAPTYGGNVYSAMPSSAVTYVMQGSRGWDGSKPSSRVLPETWNGRSITTWTPTQFDATFDANGGTFELAGETSDATIYVCQQITDTSYALPPLEPVWEGHVFNGWWTAPSDGAQITARTRVVETREVTYYAHWIGDPKVVMIRFDANGGEGGWTKELTFNTELVAPVVTRTGYTFKGWSPAVPANVPAQNVTYKAQWTANKYTVTFDANGGTGGTTQTLTYNSTITAPLVTRTGYTFKGWTPAVAAKVPAQNVTYKAQWTANKYKVTFDANGGTGGTTQTLTYNSTITAPTVTRTGYTFKGWSPAVAAKVPAQNVTYKAQWTANKYKVTFDANGGTGGTTQTLTYNSTITAPLVTRTGYTFKGWTPAVAAKVPAQNVTYKAQWTANKYKVTFDANGGTGGTTQTLTYNSTITAPTVTRTGYTFKGWTPAVAAKVPAKDVAYTAQWKQSTYTITFDANGGTGGTSSEMLPGTALARPEVECGGMVFAGWNPVPPAVSPASNATYVAQWVAPATQAWETQNADGGIVIKSCSYQYGDVVVPAEIGGKKVVEIQNYTFFGCEGITSVTIPDSVKTIGIKAFKGCLNLTSVKLPAGLKTLGQAAFQDCASLTEVDVPDGIDYLWSSTFEGCTALKHASLPEGITAIGTSSFANCKALTEVNIPFTVKTIKSFAFFSCESLADVTLPENLATIEQKAFKNCTGMKAIGIPESVTTLGKAAFFNTGLVEATVPGGIAKVDDYCFQKCAALKKMTLGDGVVETGASVWANDEALEEVVFPKTLQTLGGYAFFRCYSLVTLWNFSNLSALSTLGEKTFKHCTSLKSLSMPSHVTTLPKEMCNYCAALETVNGTANVTSIGQSAFSNCPALKSVAGLDAAALKKVKAGKEWKK